MSELEDELAAVFSIVGIPEPQRQARVIPGRRFAFDFYWPAQRLAVEVDGGIWTGGRHATGTGIEADAEKFSLAAIEGIRVMRICKTHIRSGEAITWIEKALAA